MGEFTARARAEAQISRDSSQSNMENGPIKTRVASQTRRWWLASQAPINMIINSRVVHQTAHPERLGGHLLVQSGSVVAGQHPVL